VTICAKRSGKRQILVGCGLCWWGQNPDLGVVLMRFLRRETRRARIAPTPRPPVEERNAAPQTPLRAFGCFYFGAYALHSPNSCGVGYGWCYSQSIVNTPSPRRKFQSYESLVILERSYHLNTNSLWLSFIAFNFEHSSIFAW
jgi:hypothetical protein